MCRCISNNFSKHNFKYKYTTMQWEKLFSALDQNIEGKTDHGYCNFIWFYTHTYPPTYVVSYLLIHHSSFHFISHNLTTSCSECWLLISNAPTIVKNYNIGHCGKWTEILNILLVKADMCYIWHKQKDNRRVRGFTRLRVFPLEYAFDFASSQKNKIK